MGKFLKILGILAIICVAAAAGVWFFARGIVEDNLKEQVIAAGKSIAPSFELQDLKLTSMFPLKMELSGVQINEGSFLLHSLESANLTLSSRKSFWQFSDNPWTISLELQGLRAEYKFTEPGAFSAGVSGALANIAIFPNFDLKFNCSNSHLTLTLPDPNLRLAVGKIEANIERKDFVNPVTPFKSNLSLLLMGEYKGVIFNYPVRIKTEDLIATSNEIASRNLLINFAGLQMPFTGKSMLNQSTHDWRSEFKIEELANLPEIPGFLPNGNWQGSLEGSASFLQAPNTQPEFSVNVDTGQLNGNLNFSKAGLTIQGQTIAKVSSEFSYSNLFRIKKLKGFVNLDNSVVKFGQFLDKPTGVALKSNFDFTYYDNQIKFKQSDAIFNKLQSKVWGNLSLEKENHSDFKVIVKPTNLAGYEKFIPVFSSNPMSGIVSIDMSIGGQIDEVKNTVFAVNFFELNNFKAVIGYEDKTKSVNVTGPLALTSKGSFNFHDGKLNKTKVLFDLEGDRMKISAPGGINKSESQKMRVKASFEQNGNRLGIKEAAVVFPGLVGTLQGSVEMTEKVSVDLRANFENFQSSILGESVAKLKELDFELNGTGFLTAKGTVDGQEADFLKQDLVVGGELNLHIPVLKTSGHLERLKLKKAERIQAQANPEIPTPIIQPTKILAESVLKAKVRFDEFYYNELLLKNVRLSTSYNKGQLSLGGKINDLYGGNVNIRRAKVQLLEPGPDTEFEFEADKVQISGVVNAFFPAHKFDFVGLYSGRSKGTFPYPKGLDWEKKIFVLGNFKIDEAVLRTLRFDNLAYAKLTSVQGLGTGQSVSSSTQKMEVSARAFQIKNNKVNVRGLKMVTKENNEMRANGAFDWDLNMEFRGDMYLNNAPVVTSVMLANKDKIGRLVAPFTMKGTLLDPKVSFARENVDRMLSNAIRYEAEKTQRQAQKALKEREERLNKNNKVKVKKKIKSIFQQ